MKIKKPSVTIAISAYNEEKNVKAFLESVLAQKGLGFKLNSIWIFSDGSNDRTVEFTQSYRSKKLKVFSYTKRTGKSNRLGIRFKMESTTSADDRRV